MRKSRFLLPLVLLGVSLTSCADTAELYPANAYITPDFRSNLYDTWDPLLQGKEPASPTVIGHEKQGYFNGSGKYDAPKDNYGLAEAKQWHPEYFREDGKELFWTQLGDTYTGYDITPGPIASWVDNTPLVGQVYGQTKKMSRIHSSFSKGILSKLYNGQIKCDAWSFYSWLLLGKEGYGTVFPAAMQSGSYFAFAARGGSDYTEDGHGVGRVVKFDLQVTFYKYDHDNINVSAFSYLLDDVSLQADQSSELTSLVGFSFKDVGYDPTGTIGMSISIKNSQDEKPTSSDFSEDGAHLALCLLEVFFPDSTWN